MRKFLATALSLLLLGAMALSAAAQGRNWNYRDQHSSRSYDRNYNGSYERPRREYYQYYDNRSFWDKHRDKLTTALGAAGGAVLGGAIGGGKGAAIGALLGAGGSALYTYKLRDRYHHYRY